VRFCAGPGRENDMKQARALIGGLSPAHLLADRGFVMLAAIALWLR
jgi:hypothetical protein